MHETARPPNGTQKGDVYSFAIIVQEIVLKDLPYASMADVDPDGKLNYYAHYFCVAPIP